MSIFDKPLVIGTIIGFIATIPPYLVYRHSKRVDAAAAETGSFAQILAGLNSIITLTQTDNAEMRTRIGVLDDRLDKAISDLADCVAERRSLIAQIAALETKYGIKP